MKISSSIFITQDEIKAYIIDTRKLKLIFKNPSDENVQMIASVPLPL